MCLIGSHLSVNKWNICIFLDGRNGCFRHIVHNGNVNKDKGKSVARHTVSQPTVRSTFPSLFAQLQFWVLQQGELIGVWVNTVLVRLAGRICPAKELGCRACLQNQDHLSITIPHVLSVPMGLHCLIIYIFYENRNISFALSLNLFWQPIQLLQRAHFLTNKKSERVPVLSW